MPTEPAPLSPIDVPPEDLVEVGAYETSADGFTHGLVVLAMGRDYWLVPENGRHRLMIEPRDANAVRRQLAMFDRESVGWPPLLPVDLADRRPTELATPLLWALTVVMAFWAEVTHPLVLARGEIDSAGIFARHEWWRPVTALFLHADTAHLISNAFSGVFVFAAVISAWGRKRGWAYVGLAAVLGNIAAAAINLGRPYHSIGASTAVFGGVGLLTGRAVSRLLQLPPRHRIRAMFVPFAAGVSVLALYGAGGAHVDVLAHATGFGAGFVIGLLGERELVLRGGRPGTKVPSPK